MGSGPTAARIDTHERHLVWDGCFNVRDLGGHPTSHGAETRWGAVVRSDAPDRLSAAGWAALSRHGVRTIVDLRDPLEQGGEAPAAEVASVHAPVLDLSDSSFWQQWIGVYDAERFYSTLLERWPERFAAAVSAVARARPGAVLIHCQVGRDRTGLVAALLLALAGVPNEAIAADYALSADRLRPLYDELIGAAEDEKVRARLRRENVSDANMMLGFLGELDVRGYLLSGGATREDFAAIERRLVT